MKFLAVLVAIAMPVFGAAHGGGGHASGGHSSGSHASGGGHSFSTPHTTYSSGAKAPAPHVSESHSSGSYGGNWFMRPVGHPSHVNTTGGTSEESEVDWQTVGLTVLGGVMVIGVTCAGVVMWRARRKPEFAG